jgi:predicted ArsR family transcriptional regulator
LGEYVNIYEIKQSYTLTTMNSTRDKILKTLLRKPRSTINDMAEAVGINPISVRHHLTNLQMEGLVEGQEERHGVGRPRLVYVLTEEGREKFPTRYLRLTTRLLAQMKETMPAPVVSKLFGQIAEDLASEYASDMQGLSMEERLNFVQELLSREGRITNTRSTRFRALTTRLGLLILRSVLWTKP